MAVANTVALARSFDLAAHDPMGGFFFVRYDACRAGPPGGGRAGRARWLIRLGLDAQRFGRAMMDSAMTHAQNCGQNVATGHDAA